MDGYYTLATQWHAPLTVAGPKNTARRGGNCNFESRTRRKTAMIAAKRRISVKHTAATRRRRNML